MARTIAEIKKTMTDAWMADETIRARYGLAEDAKWSSSFSSVSVENILFYVVASSIYVLERLFDKHAETVGETVAKAVVASVPWYHKMALAYQHGDSLALNETTYQYDYAEKDETKQVVKYAAVRDNGTSVRLLVSGDSNGSPTPLSDDVLTAFKHYMNRVKPAGIILSVASKASEAVMVTATVTVDPLVLNTSGVSLADGSKPVEAAIQAHLANIIYGGTFNKTKLVDAIQAVEGVTDVELGTCAYKAEGATAWTTITRNNYTGASGSYVASGLANTITYVV
jgi:hypothetical protein